MSAVIDRFKRFWAVAREYIEALDSADAHLDDYVFSLEKRICELERRLALLERRQLPND